VPQRKQCLAFAERVRSIRSILGIRLFTLAKGLTVIGTKAKLLDAVRGINGRKKIGQTLACDLITEFVTGRQDCARQRHLYGPSKRVRRNADGSAFGELRGKKTTFWRIPIAKRVQNTKARRRERLIARCYRETCSSWVGGERNIEVRYSSVPYASGYSEKVWHEKKIRSGTNSFLIVAFAPAWATDVAARGLAVVDGMLTTHAEEVEAGVFRASWVEQGAGFSLRVVSGYIVVGGGETAHGATVAAAKQCLRRRNPEYQKALSQREAEREKRWTSIRTMLEAGDAGQFADISVTLEDSFRSGNCESGTDHWVNKHFPDRACATIAELLQIADQAPRVIAACLQAIRRTHAQNRVYRGAIPA